MVNFSIFLSEPALCLNWTLLVMVFKIGLVTSVFSSLVSMYKYFVVILQHPLVFEPFSRSHQESTTLFHFVCWRSCYTFHIFPFQLYFYSFCLIKSLTILRIYFEVKLLCYFLHEDHFEQPNYLKCCFKGTVLVYYVNIIGLSVCFYSELQRNACM